MAWHLVCINAPSTSTLCSPAKGKQDGFVQTVTETSPWLLDSPERCLGPQEHSEEQANNSEVWTATELCQVHDPANNCLNHTGVLCLFCNI